MRTTCCTISSRWPVWVARTALAVLILVILVQHLRHIGVARYDHDDVEHLHAAWLVRQGLLPFLDFFEAHQPPLWYLLAPL